MLFNSFHFLIFFPIVIFVYFLLPHKYRWIFLLAASYYFYMCWRASYIFLIVISTLIDYYAGWQMGRCKLKKDRRKFLILSLCANLGLLFAFKYFNFFNGSMRVLFSHLGMSYMVPHLNVLLPVGISFYTFQTLSYSIDVYRGEKKPEKHLGIFALYVAYFPQLVAGPIERSTRLLPQFHKKQKFNYQNFKDGLLLMLWGFFKKIVIADRIAPFVNQVYNNAHDYSGLPLIIATYLFAFQIFCDFSGYSDIAIGAAKVMGFDLMKNFNRPYLAKSVSEFWKRWHISLSTWFRDYLYIPLGGNRVSKYRWYSNLFLVFLISGLWHGANWTFLIWGALHGFYLIFSIITKKIRVQAASFLNLDRFPEAHNFLKTFITFHFVVFGWIFFRANSLSDAWYIIKNLFVGLTFNWNWLGIGIEKTEMIFAFFCILIMESIHLLQGRLRFRQWIYKQPIYLRWPVYYLMILSVMIFCFQKKAEFIYFQF